MPENTKFNNQDNLENDEINLMEWLFKCIEKWHWFAISIAVCIVTAYIYIRYQPPQYNISASVLIKESDNHQSYNADAMMTMQNLGILSMTSGFENELEILKSRTLLKLVVTDLKLYIDSHKPQKFGYDIPLYHNEPVIVYITPEDAERFPQGVRLETTIQPTGEVYVELEYNAEDKKYDFSYEYEQLPAVITTEYGAITLTYPTVKQEITKPYKMITTISSPMAMSLAYSKKLNVTAMSKQTTIANISLRNSVKKRGEDFINKLVEVYNEDANSEKNLVAQKTADFIEERIVVINEELESTDNLIATFKQRSRLTDLESDARMALQENSRYQQLYTEISTQISLVEFLSDYIANENNSGEIIPSNVGLEDSELSTVIEQYNALVIERKRLLLTSAESNPAVVSVTSAIETMYHTVETTVNSVLNGLEIRKRSIEKESGSFQNRISDAPEKEKEYLSIARQQEIKAALYSALLQKREENAITLSATANNGRIIAEALADNVPVEPNSKMILFAALVLGMVIPVGCIYVQELLKFRIEDNSDVEKITSVAILANIPNGKNVKPVVGNVLVHENNNDMMEEAFRTLRTQTLFMLEKGQKVILITSSQPNEGKSFIASNLASSLAYLGKKVVIVGMDIRKPGLNKSLGFEKQHFGVSNYLNDPESKPIQDYIIESKFNKNLHILPGGTIPPNPTELVSRVALDEMAEKLKQIYDYIILDTPPIGMITDAAIIGRIADVCLYVCRSEVTPKASFKYINELNTQNKFKKLAIVINDIDLSKRKNRYSYGYGYGYGYGYEHENIKKKRQFFKRS